MNSLFVYGTLLNDEIMSELIGRTVKNSSATLFDYKCFAVADQSYPAIRPSQGSKVAGLLLTGLSSQEMQALDDYEGDQYRLELVTVKTISNHIEPCWAYVFKPEYYHQLSRSSWSNDEFRSDQLRAFIAQS